MYCIYCIFFLSALPIVITICLLLNFKCIMFFDNACHCRWALHGSSLTASLCQKFHWL